MYTYRKILLQNNDLQEGFNLKTMSDVNDVNIEKISNIKRKPKVIKKVTWEYFASENFSK